MVYNVINCAGFEGAAAGWFTGGSCMLAKVGFVLLFFLIAIVRKWGAEEWGISFNLLISLLVGLVVYFVVVTITGNFRTSFILSLLIAVVGGYVGGWFFETEGD